MSSLEMFGIEGNYVHGNIPIEITKLRYLKGINFGINNLSGPIPSALFNVSSLTQILLMGNGLSGTLPSTTGLWLPNLENLFVDMNQLSGNIPLYLSNSSKLTKLDLSSNMFTGTVPTNFGQLTFLVHFNVAENQLEREPGSAELGVLTAITNCSYLEYLVIAFNPFGGALPNSIGNLSSSLQLFSAIECQFVGQLPKEIGSLNVNLLILSGNNLQGTIPSTIAKMENLQRLYLYDNKLQGSIPRELCRLGKNLGEVLISGNNISGSIPDCLGNLTNLQRLSLDSNSLSSSIPLGIWSLASLISLNLSSNSLGGSLDPHIRPMKALSTIDLSWNQISGEIPTTINSFQSLTSLDMSRNLLHGSIPQSLGNLTTLDYLDISYNNLSGVIPKSLESLSLLKYLNFSFNKLSGEIPSGGPFKNFTMQSFLGNGPLCGQVYLHVPSCINRKARKSHSKNFLLWTLPAIALIILFIVAFFLWKRVKKNNVQNVHSVSLLLSEDTRIVSYQELCRATDNFCEFNLLGEGSFGAVYKGILSDGMTVAVKILNLQQEGAIKSFDAECRVLRAVRHRNLVKVISSCSNIELRALILQYMSNGSLEKWLYSHNYCLNLLQRVSIMLDVAMALEYLHHGHLEPVIHCDLKPSNVLLDEDMVAHVGDFGIAKILAENQADTQTKTLGTLGYIAPEYGAEGRVSRKGDVYSYGIMLLETFTRMRPTDDTFVDLSLREWVNALLPEKVMEVLDSGLLSEEDGNCHAIDIQRYVSSIMEIGLQCCATLPDERCDIKDVVTALNKIKLQLCQNGYS